MRRLWICALFVSALWAERIPNLYIVELSGAPAARAIAKQGRRATMREAARVRTAQATVRAALVKRGATVLDSVSTVANALIVQIPDAQAGQLATTPGVMRVHQARRFKLLLDHAVALSKVPDAWNLVGGKDQAGAGAKIGILDTGIDITHPAFQDASLPMPAGYPLFTNPGDQAYTNNKVIVARSYHQDLNPRDRFGHGTGVAMAAAGETVEGPLATITGVAPKAWLGIYKITSGSSGSADDPTILKALDDAFNDGMDVVNLSFGDVAAPRPQDDVVVSAVEQAVQAGMLVVTAAGNEGPDPNTIDSPATAPSAIAVGASESDRIFTAVTVDGVASSFYATAGDGPMPSAPIAGPLADVQALDQDGMACGTLPSGSLTGHVALILRGVCTFEQKLLNVQQAGAIAGLVYTDAARPDAINMSVGSATLPALMVSYQDGTTIKTLLASTGDLQVSLAFNSPAPYDPNQLASFSSRGPNADLAIKPDLLAVGDPIYTAAETTSSSGPLFDPSGFTLTGGTSFSTPLVAGAVAVLKAARPGLTADEYRSLLVNGATPLVLTAASDRTAAVQQAGAGVLNLMNAIQSTVAAYPTSVSFGTGGGTVDASRGITLYNVGTAADTYSISVVPLHNTPAPAVSANSLQLAPGGSQTVTLQFTADALSVGEYQGFIEVQGSSMAAPIHIPYWYAVPSDTPNYLTVLYSSTSGRAGASMQDAFEFRITDASGLAIMDANPAVTAVSGNGSVDGVVSYDATVPGAYSVNVTLGPGRGADNLFRIQVGDLTQDVTITAN